MLIKMVLDNTIELHVTGFRLEYVTDGQVKNTISTNPLTEADMNVIINNMISLQSNGVSEISFYDDDTSTLIKTFERSCVLEEAIAFLNNGDFDQQHGIQNMIVFKFTS